MNVSMNATFFYTLFTFNQYSTNITVLSPEKRKETYQGNVAENIAHE